MPPMGALSSCGGLKNIKNIKNVKNMLDHINFLF